MRNMKPAYVYVILTNVFKLIQAAAANWTNVADSKLLISISGDLSYMWPVKRVCSVDGDVIIGGLMMVHEREDSLTCGPIMPQGGIQALEAMLYTLDYINNKPGFLPGFRIGAHILDDCDKYTYGLEQAVDFIKGIVLSYRSIFLTAYSYQLQ